jgi:hypothetical protein
MKLLALPSIATIAAICVVALTFDAPRLRDEAWAASVQYGDSDRYFAEYGRNRTLASRGFDVALGVASFGISTLVLLLATRCWSISAVLKARTPRRRWTIFVAANVVWAYYIWATGRMLMVQFNRQEFPPWADSMGIPIAGIAAFAVVGGLLMNLGLALYLYRAQLPVGMWVRPTSLRAWILTGGGRHCADGVRVGRSGRRADRRPVYAASRRRRVCVAACRKGRR